MATLAEGLGLALEAVQVSLDALPEGVVEDGHGRRVTDPAAEPGTANLASIAGGGRWRGRTGSQSSAGHAALGV